MTDLDIASAAELRPIQRISDKLGIDENELELFGKWKAKLPLHLMKQEDVSKAKLILVTAISPTPSWGRKDYHIYRFDARV